MKFLIINNEFPPVGGGAGRTSYYLARELTRMGHEVSVLTSTTAAPMDLPAIPRLKVHRVFGWRKSEHEAGKRGMAMFLGLGLLRFAGLLLTQRYDLIEYFSSIPAGLLSILAPRHASVMWLRGLDVPGRDNDSFSAIHRLLKPLNIRTWYWADAVTASSENLAETAHQHAPDLPIIVQYNGVDTDIFKPGSPREPNSRFEIIGVSRLIKLKGFQYLIEAMAQLPADQFHLSLVGRGSYEDELQSLTDRLGVRDRVSFLGFHSHETLPELMQKSDLFVLPSYGDSYASAFLEAMATGVPVIAADCGGAQELIRHQQNGWLVPPHDVDALAEAIKTLAQNQVLRCAIAETGRHEIHAEHSWTAYALKHIEMAETILAARQKANTHFVNRHPRQPSPKGTSSK